MQPLSDKLKILWLEGMKVVSMLVNQVMIFFKSMNGY